MRSSLAVAAYVLATFTAAADVPTVIGNGRLTAAVAPDGRIVSITWPRPGLFEQLGQDGLALENGEAADRIERIGPGTLRIMGARMPEGADWSIVVCIPADTDALIIEQESGKAPAWLADFSPMPSGVPGLPGAKSIFPGLGGFADMRQGDAHFVFRTEDLSSREAERTEDLADDPNATLTQWNRLGDGVWIAIDGVMELDEPADSALRMDGSAIRASFGQSASGAYDGLSRARGFTSANAPALDSSGLHFPADPAMAIIAQEALATLLAVQASETGAMVRRPWGIGADGQDWPRDGVWAIAALRRAGAVERAERLLAFYAAAVESDAEPDGPYGSMPTALQADGDPALPPYIRDIEGPARLLAAAAQSAESGALLSDDVRAAAERAMAFLTDWAHPVSRFPLAGYDPTVKRDRATASQLPVLAAGLDAGLRILTQQHPEAERWIRRMTEVDALVRSHCLDETGAPMIDDPLPFLNTKSLNGPATEAAGEALLPRIVTEQGGVDWAAAYGAALWLPTERKYEVRDAIRPFAEGANEISGDTRAAAWAYLTVMATEP